MVLAGIDLANLDTKPFLETQVKNVLDTLFSIYPEINTHLYTLNEEGGFGLFDLPTNSSHVLEKVSSDLPAIVEVQSLYEYSSIFIQNKRNLGFFSRDLDAWGEYSLLSPIGVQGTLFGFLLTILPAGMVQADLNQSIFDNTALSIGSNQIMSQMLENLQKRDNDLSIMLEVNTHLNMAATKTDYLDEISRFGKYFIHFDRVVLILHPEDTPEFFIIDSIEGDQTGLQLGMSYPVHNSLVSQTLKTAQRFVFKKSQGQKAAGIYHGGDMDNYPYAQVIGFPLSNARNGPGVLVLESAEEYTLKQSEIGIFEMISQSLGAAMTRFSLYERLNNYATIDTLTHLYNLRALNQRFEEELARAGRYHNSLVVLFLDLDKFKMVNDTYGHLTGDFVLRETAQIIRDSIRTSDIPGRYGGEEFVVIMVNADAESCMASAQRICTAIHDYKYEMNDIQIQNNISIGLAEFPQDGETMAALIQSADTAMYAAKGLGGNQVVKYSEGMIPKSET